MTDVFERSKVTTPEALALIVLHQQWPWLWHKVQFDLRLPKFAEHHHNEEQTSGYLTCTSFGNFLLGSAHQLLEVTSHVSCP